MMTENDQLTQLPVDEGTYVGPARVRQTAGERVQLEFRDEVTWATLALGYPYQPASGDIVLAIGQSQSWYVIGVIRGAGKTRLIVPGDFEVHAPRGHIGLTAGKGVTVKSPEVRISAWKLELAARRVIERFAEATRWVKEVWQVRAGRIRTQVEGDYQIRARRINERAEGDVKIDGNKIHLG